MKVYKYKLEITDNQKIKLQGKPLSVQNQYGELMLYATYEENNTEIEYDITVHGTGHLMSANESDYIGTVLFHNGDLAFHVFIKQAN